MGGWESRTLTHHHFLILDPTMKLGMVFAAIFDLFRNLAHGKSLLPLAPASRVVATSRAIYAQEARKAARSQRLLEGFQRVLPELLVGHLHYGARFIVVHGVNLLRQFT